MDRFGEFRVATHAVAVASLMPIGDTVERHGGLDAVVDKIDRAEEETEASAGAGMVDDFRLWGSSRCRRMGVTLSEGGGDIEG